MIKSLKPHRFKDNPKEEEIFTKFIKDYGNSINMSRIVFGADGRGVPPEYLTEREEEIVAATLQWLGSPVGIGFLRDCGFEQKT